ncbi:MAG: methionine--tRNA ligase [Patescibacteria group bacterium]
MKSKKTFYITTTLPYVNDTPHIGHTLEYVRADMLARTAMQNGRRVFFNTGTDEHGQKVYDKATTLGEDVQLYVDRYAAKFREVLSALNITKTIHFTRTTDSNHILAVQEMWRRCLKNGDIYKARQIIKYCKGCELEKTDSELNYGKCPLHPNYIIDVREEENYFFSFSKYKDKLLKLYAERQNFVIPSSRLNEVRTFVENGLRDFSVSRLKEKMPWGVPVPDDEAHVMYVWFDALTNYISALGWPEDLNGTYRDFWEQGEVVQLCGKDNLRQQCAIWQAMLGSAGLPHPTRILVGGFLISDGHKMSKSIGNVIDPFEILKKYGTDALRYYLLRHINPFDDTDVTVEHIHEMYTAHLVNGIGNLASRIMKMAETYLDVPVDCTSVSIPDIYSVNLARFAFHEVMDSIFVKINSLDERIASEEPFKKVKEDVEMGKLIITSLVQELFSIANLLAPAMPETAQKIFLAIEKNKKPENMFPRIS